MTSFVPPNVSVTPVQLVQVVVVVTPTVSVRKGGSVVEYSIKLHCMLVTGDADIVSVTVVAPANRLREYPQRVGKPKVPLVKQPVELTHVLPALSVMLLTVAVVWAAGTMNVNTPRCPAPVLEIVATQVAVVQALVVPC